MPFAGWRVRVRQNDGRVTDRVDDRAAARGRRPCSSRGLRAGSVADRVGGLRTRGGAPEVRGAPEIPRAAEALPAVHFAAGATAIRPRDLGILAAHARWLHGERTRVILIEGHADGPEDSAFSRATFSPAARP
jgi:outer membrane protein OmpA-like peptidoglycan-associated protein